MFGKFEAPELSETTEIEGFSGTFLEASFRMAGNFGQFRVR
ncbi:MAG: hypothetical protein HLUCCO16_20655 [Phormidium sp. OSCR]|nr:MAG: hypothetical protein HLUCCO16_20655 [Phormidium sp. OSCR]